MEIESAQKPTRGRPLAFDPDTAINAAMRVFWLKGYEGTSLSDLTAAMGINKPSLYAKFGDKRGLFLSAIAHYEATISRKHIEPLIDETSIRDAIEGHFASIIQTFAATGSPPGCLIGTVATDLAGRDDAIRTHVATFVSTAEAFLTQRFKELGGAPMDESVLAELVISVGQSLAARARMGASADDLNAMTERFVTAVYGPKEPKPPD